MIDDYDDEPLPIGCAGDNGTGCLNVPVRARCRPCRYAEITVCDACFRASCWHGEFMCAKAPSAGTVDKMRFELDALSAEHPSHYSAEKIAKVCG